MLPLSCPVGIIYPRVKNEFSQETPLPESLEPRIYYLPAVLMELGLKIYVWRFTGSWLGASLEEAWGADRGWGQLYLSEAGPQEDINHCGLPAFQKRLPPPSVWKRSAYLLGRSWKGSGWAPPCVEGRGQQNLLSTY